MGLTTSTFHLNISVINGEDYKKLKMHEKIINLRQRKQLRRHMSVKHQKTLPKKWKRRDDAAVMNPHSNKFLQKDPDFIAVKQKQIQINR